MKSGYWILPACVLLAAATGARADYLFHADNVVGAFAGTDFDVTVMLTSDDSNAADSVVFTVRFDQPGLLLRGYQWQDVFSAGFDLSEPGAAALSGGPVSILADTHESTTYVGDMDIYLDAFSPVGSFDSGQLVTLQLSVPWDMAYDEITADILPDQVYNDGQPVAALPSSFTITPEPAALAVLAAGAVGLLRRRRHRAA